MKRSHQAEDTPKEDCQFFGPIVTKALTLDEGFQYPITSVPLSIATIEGEVCANLKRLLRTFFH